MLPLLRRKKLTRHAKPAGRLRFTPRLEALERRDVPSSISGVKWLDANANGVRDSGEPGLAGWTIYLDQNRNGQRDGGEPFTVTNAGGNYSFTGLAAGFYVVAEEQHPGWTQTFPNPAATPLANGGFETGAFSPWAVTGNREVRTASYGVSPTEGTYQALLTSGLGSTARADLEAFLGLNPNSLNALGNGTVIEGSAVRQTFTAPRARC